MHLLIVDFIVELASGFLQSFTNGWSPKTKFDKNIERLMKEPWFAELEKDFRYGHIIYNNRKVKKFLSNEKNVDMLLSKDNEKANFIDLVKEEHSRFTRLG